MSSNELINKGNPTNIHVLCFAKGKIVSESIDQLRGTFYITKTNSVLEFKKFISSKSFTSLPEAIVLEADDQDEYLSLIKFLKSNIIFTNIVTIVLDASTKYEYNLEVCKNSFINDYYAIPFNIENIAYRILFLIKFNLNRSSFKAQESSINNRNYEYKIPITKRIFDITVSSGAIIALSPVFLSLGLLVWATSKGPIIYSSKRVGTGYKVFNFYKFRSMVIDADTKINEYASLNQYASETEGKKSTFIKIKNDPRVTWIGKIIRKTSLDELPQLFNILKGDMSLVGNRPLPVYEAEHLTSDEWAWRFLAPSGLTGLWQVNKRGQANMSDDERRQLDNFYAKNHSFMMDLKIIFKTLPAMIQKENV